MSKTKHKKISNIVTSDVSKIVGALPKEEMVELAKALQDKGHMVDEIEEAGGVLEYVEMLQEYKEYSDALAKPRKSTPFRNHNAKLERNGLCICGSNKKYKKCCMVAYK